jgi:NADPH:quinone reductase
MKKVIIERFGDESVLELREVEAPQITQAHQVRVQIAWAGLNFIDIYFREGRYPGSVVPMTPGIEATGVVLEVSAGSVFQIGDRVAFTTGILGTYAQQIVVPEERLVKLPDNIPLKTACAAIEHGLTADMLANQVARIQSGQTALVHAAAGGVGGILVQLLKQKGIRVLGTVSSQSKADWLSTLGVEPVRYDDQDWLAQVRTLTNGRGVDVVFDSVGLTTFNQSLEALAMRGHLVLFGAASGVVPPFSPTELMKKSLTLTRPVLNHFLTTPDELRSAAARLFTALSGNDIQLRIDSEFTLEQVGAAQARLASRQAQGKILLSIAPEIDVLNND